MPAMGMESSISNAKFVPPKSTIRSSSNLNLHIEEKKGEKDDVEENLEYLGARECTPNDDDHCAEGGLEVETLSRHYRKTDGRTDKATHAAIFCTNSSENPEF